MTDLEKTREQLTEEVAELRQNLDALVSYLPEAFFIVDAPDVKIRLASRDTQQMLGVSLTELKGIHDEEHFEYYQVFYPDGTPVEVEQLPLSRALSAGEVIRNEEWLMQMRNGKRFPTLCQAGPVRDEDGTICGAVICWHDISDRKQAEEALRKAHDQLEEKVKQRTAELREANERLQQEVEERRRKETALRQSEVRYKTLVETSPDAILMIDLKGNIIFASQQAIQVFGCDSVEDLCRQKVTSLVAEEERQRLTANLSLLLQQGVRRQIEYIGVRRDGSRYTGEVSSAVLHDDRGEPRAFMALVEDVTDRKQAQEALRQNEEKHRGLLEACPDAIVMADLDGKILFASSQTGELVGLSDQEELVGQSVFDYVIEDDRRRLAENIPRLLQTGTRHNTEYTVLRQDGTTVPTEISSAIIRDATGQPIAIMVVIRDITGRKQAQDTLQREHRTLKHLLQSSDHERQTIAYEIHDGLAQYLAGAIMQFDVYKSHREKRPNEATKAYDAAMTLLRQGHSEARRLIAGIRHPVLDEAGVVEAVAHLINEQNRGPGPQIEFRSLIKFSRLVPLLENAIYRIIQEGMTNACKYSQSERVRVILFQQKDRLRIEIRDWGIGFNTKDIKEGSYGLTGIRERARLLGGRYRLQSAAGKGTRIVVELPLMEREE
jgi:PAS domain S-box-containing protein